MRKARLGAAYRGPQQEVGEKFGLTVVVRGVCCSLLTLACIGLFACGEPSSGPVVAVVNDGAPVEGADVLLRRMVGGEVLERAATGADGRVRFAGEHETDLVVQVILTTRAGTFTSTRDLNRLSDADVVFDLEGFEPVRELVSPPRSTDSGGSDGDQIQDEPARSVLAVVELDRVAGMPLLPLTAMTAAGRVSLQSIFAEVGIELRLAWDEEIPMVELEQAGWPTCDGLWPLAESHRDGDVPGPEEWHFYAILIPSERSDFELSCLVDGALRRASVISVPLDQDLNAEALHAVAHELGHQLGLEHPWETGVDTRSLMSYPWRWLDWDWSDARVFSIDETGRRHVLTGAEHDVRPGGGPFLGR